VTRALGLLALLAAQAPQPVFEARVETVYVDAVVTRGGRPVAGLRASDFELLDDGVLQRAELVTADSLPLTSVLAFDSSASVAGAKLLALRAAGNAFLDALRPQDEVGVLAFCEELVWLAQPTPDRARARAALQELRADRATAARDALFVAMALPASSVRTLVVLFSDGVDNMSWLQEGQLREVARKSNALVHVVATRPLPPLAVSRGEPAHLRSLRQVAEATGGRLWQAESPDRVKTAFLEIAEAMGQRYVLRYEPASARRPGWHRLELKLRGQAGDVRARPGYWASGSGTLAR
jgi:VWFA-related protein